MLYPRGRLSARTSRYGSTSAIPHAPTRSADGCRSVGLLLIALFGSEQALGIGITETPGDRLRATHPEEPRLQDRCGEVIFGDIRPRSWAPLASLGRPRTVWRITVRGPAQWTMFFDNGGHVRRSGQTFVVWV